MTQLVYRAMIQSSIFPLLAQLQGQTVVVPEKDQTYIPNINPQDQNNPVDRGIPQIFYGHNVMPSSYGYQSVGYLQRTPAIGGWVLEDIVEINRTTNGYVTYAALDSSNVKSVAVLTSNREWAYASGAPGGLGPANKLSTATINGVTYLCIARVGIYRVTLGVPSVLTPVYPAGLNLGTTEGILSSMGYMVAWSRTGVAWSNISNPLDFVPSDVTGAGAGEIQDAQGELVWCQDTSYGFIIYTSGNAVQSTWSGNTQYPWNFRGIANSGGISSGRVVSKEGNGQQYVYTSNGLQQIYHTGAKTVLPFITDFISGKVYDDFNPATGIFTINTAGSNLNTRVSYISDRYLVVSYGLPTSITMTHAVILDVAQGRLGKLKIDHVACFEHKEFVPASKEAPRDALAFMASSGLIKTVNFTLSSPTRDGVMLLGKYQAVRNYLSQLTEVTVDNIDSASFSLLDYPSLDGRNFITPVAGYLMEQGGQHRKFHFSNWAKNHTLGITGAFNVVSLEIGLNVDGNV